VKDKSLKSLLNPLNLKNLLSPKNLLNLKNLEMEVTLLKELRLFIGADFLLNSADNLPVMMLVVMPLTLLLLMPISYRLEKFTLELCPLLRLVAGKMKEKKF